MTIAHQDSTLRDYSQSSSQTQQSVHYAQHSSYQASNTVALSANIESTTEKKQQQSIENDYKQHQRFDKKSSFSATSAQKVLTQATEDVSKHETMHMSSSEVKSESTTSQVSVIDRKEASEVFQTQLNTKSQYKPFKASDYTTTKEQVVYAKEFSPKPKVKINTEMELIGSNKNQEAKQKAALFLSKTMDKKGISQNQSFSTNIVKSEEQVENIEIMARAQKKIEEERQEILRQEQVRLDKLEQEKRELQIKREEIKKQEQKSTLKRAESLKATKSEQEARAFTSVKLGYVNSKKSFLLDRGSSMEPPENTSDSPARRRKNVW